MKPPQKALWAVLAGLASTAVPGLAQTREQAISPAPVANAERTGRVIVSDPQAKDSSLTTTADRQMLSQQIKERMARFERLRETYLREQADLLKRLRGAATDEDRQRIREQIRESRDAWLDRTNSLREELKDRISQVRDRLPSHREVLDNARDNARDALNQERRRRGTD